jgi:hypothetical protein
MLSALWYCEKARAIASLLPAAARSRQTFLCVGPVGAGRRHAGISVGKLRAKPLADRGARVSPRGQDRIGIDVVADLARDVDLARRRQGECDEGGFELFVGEDRAERSY